MKANIKLRNGKLIFENKEYNISTLLLSMEEDVNYISVEDEDGRKLFFDIPKTSIPKLLSNDELELECSEDYDDFD